MSGDPRTKKVSAYPFAVQLKTAAAVIAGQIQKVTLEGFLAEIPATALQPGDKFEVSFEIPVYKVTVTQPAVMVKIYSHWGGSKETAPAPASNDLTAPSPTTDGRAVVQLVEVHFQPLSDAGRSAISQFMRAIKQV